MRTREIKPGFWKNEDLMALPIEARLLYAGLWCIADREGRLEDRPRRIKVELFPCDNLDIDSLLTKLADSRFIVRYETEGKRVIRIPTFKRHQKLHPNEAKSALPDQPLTDTRVMSRNVVTCNDIPLHVETLHDSDPVISEPSALSVPSDLSEPSAPSEPSGASAPVVVEVLHVKPVIEKRPAFDESFQAFRKLCESCTCTIHGDKGSWIKAWAEWSKLDGEQRVDAFEGVRIRIERQMWDDPVLKSLPQNVLAEGKYTRPLPPVRAPTALVSRSGQSTVMAGQMFKANRRTDD